jgi:aminoglycoside 2''-phosphotransferase
VTTTEAAEIISQHCSDMRLRSIEVLGEGDFCIAYLVNDVWVFRFAKHETAAASMFREICLLPLLAPQFNVAVPSPQLITSEPALMRYAYLPGLALTRERFLKLDEIGKNRCAGQVGEFLSQMHSTDLRIAKRCNVNTADYFGYYGSLLRRAQTQLTSQVSKVVWKFVETSLVEYIESNTANNYTPSLLHGDLSPDHVLFNPQTSFVTAILDFGDIVIGDPAADVVLIYEDHGLDFLRRFLTMYGARDRATFLRRVYRLYVLGAIEWAVMKSEQDSPEVEASIAELGRLGANGPQELSELLSSCANP